MEKCEWDTIKILIGDEIEEFFHFHKDMDGASTVEVTREDLDNLYTTIRLKVEKNLMTNNS
ncbi:hypothetical protein RVS70_05505 [Virgibacillus sp. M23]|uniref:hypothetical protein n=1 Tax=Virgibacillus sp. M23 TaxID=3079030 RepID=UPI002A91BF2F|nr:hypothetical protein [Virgibacillus sp. M23]MDY7043658.1 hypothetical protein [Virgibacillus sp. M23]